MERHRGLYGCQNKHKDRALLRHQCTYTCSTRLSLPASSPRWGGHSTPLHFVAEFKEAGQAVAAAEAEMTASWSTPRRHFSASTTPARSSVGVS